MARRKGRARIGRRPRIIPNKGRRLQVAPTGRKLFGDAEKEAFLDRFSENCNCSLSARRIGFHYRTVLRHWREDAVFGADCEAALRLGYARVEELALRGAAAALDPERLRPFRDDRATPPETLAMTPEAALQLLREHKRGLAGVKKPGPAPSAASNAEVFGALVKRLRAFGIRVEEEEARKAGAPPALPPPAGDAGDPSTGFAGPPPRSGEEPEGEAA